MSFFHRRSPGQQMVAAANFVTGVSPDVSVRFRLAVLVSHFIQYHVPLFRALAAHPQIDLTVFVCREWGAATYVDPGFGLSLRWDRSLTDGYRWDLLPNWSPRPHSPVWGAVNPKIISRIWRGHFHAVWVHGWTHITTWLAIVSALATDTPLLLRGEAHLLSHSQRLSAWLKRLLLVPVFRRTAGFLSIGRRSSEFYQHFGVSKERIFLTPYAVDNEFFNDEARRYAPCRQQLKADLGLDPALPVILFSGELIARKRHFDLLAAFEILGPVASVVFLGDGELRASLESASRRIKNVHFAGFKNQTELPPYFALADVFVLPSAYEPWGLVLNEAMCFGLPVIASDGVGAGADLIEHGVNGFIYPAGQADLLAQCLRQVLSDPAQRARMGQASRRKIESWSYSQDVEGVLRCLQSIALQPTANGRFA